MQPGNATRPAPPAVWASAALAFCLVAILNTGGYRFGISDQAFYLPAIQRHLVPESFPRDRIVLDDQDKLNVFTRVTAAAVRATGVESAPVFALLHALTLVTLFGGAMAVGRALGLSPWALTALAAALTLRHRVGITGANTLEGYMHPRMLAFAVGLWALAAVLRGRTWPTFIAVAFAAVIHPTTALWVGIWVGATALFSGRRDPRLLGALAAAGGAAAVWAVWLGPLRGHLVLMDDAWRGVLAGKDYLFPETWPAAGWLFVVLYFAAVAGPFWWRRRTGALRPRESAMAGGLGILAAVLVVSFAASAASVALAVQLQVPRVLWMFDFLGTCYVVWLLADVWAGPGDGPPAPSWRRWLVVGLIVAAAVARGGYVKWVEHPERPLIRVGLAQDDWQDVLSWLAVRTPLDTHVLAHPGHAWRYGVSVRVAAGRDVFFEEVKDTAMALYSRRVAARVIDRIQAAGDADAWTAERVGALAARYDLDYLVSERPFDLPVAYRNRRFTVYRLDAPSY